jgi:hypothetical protein
MRNSFKILRWHEADRVSLLTIVGKELVNQALESKSSVGL